MTTTQNTTLALNAKRVARACSTGTAVCSLCEQPTDSFSAYLTGVIVCRRCRDDAQRRYDEEVGE